MRPAVWNDPAEARDVLAGMDNPQDWRSLRCRMLQAMAVRQDAALALASLRQDGRQDNREELAAWRSVVALARRMERRLGRLARHQGEA